MKRRPPAGNIRLVRSNGLNVVRFATNKGGKTVQCESHLEYALVLTLLRDRNVLDFQSQPLEIKYKDENHKDRVYVPDFLVERVNGSMELHEVGARYRRSTREDIQRRDKAGLQYCAKRGWRFVVHDENSLPKGTELVNLILLEGFRASANRDESIADVILESLPSDGTTISIFVLAQEVSEQVSIPIGPINRTLLYMLWHQSVQTNMQQLLLRDEQFAPKTVVWRPRI